MKKFLAVLFLTLFATNAFAVDYYLIKMDTTGPSNDLDTQKDVMTVTGNSHFAIQLNDGTGTCRQDGYGGTDVNYDGQYAHETRVLLARTDGTKGERYPLKLMAITSSATSKPTPGKVMNVNYSVSGSTCTLIVNGETVTYKKMWGSWLN